MIIFLKFPCINDFTSRSENSKQKKNENIQMIESEEKVELLFESAEENQSSSYYIFIKILKLKKSI